MPPPTRAQLPPLPSCIRTLTDEQSSALNKRNPATNHHPDQCRTCGGAKTFLWYANDRTDEVVEYDCPCINQYLLLRWLAYSGISDGFMRLGWRDLLDPDPAVAETVLEYVENREAYIGRGIGLVLTGPRGTGKTLLSNLLVKDLISHGVTCYATTFSDMIDEFAEGWRDREVSLWFSQRVRNAQVLLIDDLGRERNKGPESVGDNMLETITRYRVANNLPTLITTNLSEADVATGYGGHTMSLLSEKAIFLPVPGGDARRQVSDRAMKEIRLGIKQRPVVIG